MFAQAIDVSSSVNLLLSCVSMCRHRAAGLPCVVLNGVNKSAAYQLGRPIDRRAMLAQWNAVYVDDDWRLLDVFWASTCLVGRHSGDWALLDSDGDLVDSDDVQVNSTTCCCYCYRLAGIYITLHYFFNVA